MGPFSSLIAKLGQVSALAPGTIAGFELRSDYIAVVLVAEAGLGRAEEDQPLSLFDPGLPTGGSLSRGGFPVRGIGDRQCRSGVLLPLGKEQRQTGTNILWVRGLNTKGEK